MENFSERFIKSEELEKRIRTTCSFNIFLNTCVYFKISKGVLL